MKKILAFLFVAFVLSASAQITILRSDYGAIGDKVKYAVDTPAASSLSTIVNLTGANKTWDFSASVIANKFDSNLFVSPSFASNPPASANLLLVSENNSQFENVDTGFVRLILDQPQYNINGLSLKIFKFPFTYGSVLIDSIIYTKAGPPADFNFTPSQVYGSDSLRFDIRAYSTIEGTGYGTITLPDTGCNALQIKTTGISYTVMSAHGSPLGAGWVVVNPYFGVPVYQKSINVQWMSKNSKSFIAQAAMDTSGTVVQGFTYLINKIAVPKITFVTPNNAQRGQTLNITIRGTNTHFTQGANIPVYFVQGLRSLIVNSVNTLNDSILTVNLTVKQSDSLGFYDVTVYDPVYGAINFTSSFRVYASTVLPQLNAVTPPSGSRKQTLNISISGSATHFTRGVDSVSFYYVGALTTKIKVNSFTITNDSLLSSSITIDSFASIGIYDLYVKDLVDGTLSLAGAFSVISTGVNEAQDASAFVFIYPNPANDVLTVSFPPQSSSVNIRLVDIAGRNVKSINTSNNHPEIDISDLNNGIYFCIIIAKDFTASRKIMIDK